MPRIVVIGTSCSGKTTLAKKIANKFGVKHIELDFLHWLPDWQPKATSIFIDDVCEAVAQENWVCDGNYSIVRQEVWSRTTHIVWLNYSFPRMFWQAIRRTVSRAITREEICNGNRESFRRSFLSKDSIMIWVLTTFHKRRLEYPILLRSPEFSHIVKIELKTPRQTEKFLANF